MKTLLSISLLTIFALTAIADTDISGKWSGSFNITGPNGETKEDTAFLVLKQTGGAITGTVGPNEDEQYPIGKGTIEGDKITLEADANGHTVKLDLVLAADHIKGEANMAGDNGESMKAKLDVTRVK